LFPTIAAAVGAPQIVPTDRAIDGVNQLPFFEGKQKSNRTSVLYYTSNQPSQPPRAVKWYDWKFHYSFQTEPGAAPPGPPTMRLFHLLSDPREDSDVKDANPWAESVMDKLVADFVATFEKYPNVPPNQQDPYVPVKK
jgi:arylsulfatase